MTIPSTNSNRTEPENLWILLAFGLALVIRLAKLGAIPLSDAEAGWALQSLGLAQGTQPILGAQPAYVMLTSVFFYIFHASNFMARIVPALMGSLLVLLPFFFRDHLGKKTAIVFALAMALDPGLLAISRQAGTPILAVSSLMLAWAAWRSGHERWAGVLAGVALLSGPSLWMGVAGLGLSFGLARVLQVKLTGEFERGRFITSAWYALGTYLALGSLFLLQPRGLGAGLDSLPALLRGSLQGSGISALRLLAALGVYQLFPLIFAIIRIMRGSIDREARTIFLFLWLVSSLIVALAYPSRQVADLAWALIPLWALAAIEIAGYLAPIVEGTWETMGVFALTVSILAFAWNNFSSIALADLAGDALAIRTYVLLGSIALLILSVVLVALGWSTTTALQGSSWGALFVLTLYTVGMAFFAAELRSLRTVEMWKVGPQVAQAEVLAARLDDLSRWKTGAADSLDITILGLDAPSLTWALRDWNVFSVGGNTLSGIPAVVITGSELASPELQASYRGQDIRWRSTPLWNASLPFDLLRWFMLHELPQSNENIILWARTDLFVDSQNLLPNP